MDFSPEKYFVDDYTFEESLDGDQSSSSTDYNASEALLGTSRDVRVSQETFRSWRHWLTERTARIFLAIALFIIAIESTYVVEVQRRANTRFLGPSMSPSTPARRVALLTDDL
jgi:hypothetical protein